MKYDGKKAKGDYLTNTMSGVKTKSFMMQQWKITDIEYDENQTLFVSPPNNEPLRPATRIALILSNESHFEPLGPSDI